MLFEIESGVVAPLTNAFTAIGKPGTTLLDNLTLHGQVEQLASSANPIPIHNIKFHLPKGGGNLIFDDFHTCPVADHLLPALDGIQATNIQPDRSIEFERVSTRRRFWIAKEHADLLPYLVDENNARFGFVDNACQLAHRL